MYSEHTGLKQMYQSHITILCFIYFSGVHHKKLQCGAEKVVKQVERTLSKANSFLYPKSIAVTSVLLNKTVKQPKGDICVVQ